MSGPRAPPVCDLPTGPYATGDPAAAGPLSSVRSGQAKTSCRWSSCSLDRLVCSSFGARRRTRRGPGPRPRRWSAGTAPTCPAGSPRGTLDEVVVDADVGQRTRDGAGRRADRHAEQRDEEDQAEQHAQNMPPSAPRAGEVVQLAGLGLVGALLPTTPSRRPRRSPGPASRGCGAFSGALGAFRRVELPDGQRGHRRAPFRDVGSTM